MYHPTTRVLTVLELLQAHGQLRSADLAARLEVDGRSVRRYIAMLQELGVPISSERGRHGGYRLRPGFKLPPLMFTDDEALAVTLGLLAARRLGLAAAAPAVEGALAKLERVLPHAVREQARAVQEQVTFDIPRVETPPDSAIVRLFSTAASRRQRLQIAYLGWEGASERAIDPYGLVYRLGTWYAVGWCHLRAAIRVFRLDRVERATPLDATFTPPDDFDALGHVQRAIATMPNGWAIEVLLDTTLDDARDWISPVLGTLEAAPGGVLLRCQGSDLERMARYLVALPWDFTVRQPDALVAELGRVVARLSRSIGQGTASPPDVD